METGFNPENGYRKLLKIIETGFIILCHFTFAIVNSWT